MKTLVVNNTRRLLGLASAALLALAAPTAQALVLPVSPVGQWDCIMDGSGQTGILFLNFTDDLDPNTGLPTFEGLWIQAGQRVQKPDSDRSDGDGRGDSSSGSGNTITNLFGGAFIHGVAGEVANNGGPNDWLADSRGRRGNWFFNSKGQIVGSYYTVVNASATVTNFFQTCAGTNFSIPLTNGGTFPFSFDVCFTNAVLNTNVFWVAPDNEFGFTNLTFINTNFITGLIGITNNTSFVGKVVRGKRITLTGTSAYGKFTIRGVPLQPISTASGLPVDGPYFWTGTKKQNGNQISEQFHLTTTGIANVFTMVGQGPAYTYGTNSFCMISANKRIGFAVTELPFNADSDTIGADRATVGQFINTRKAIGAKTLGDTFSDPEVIKFDTSMTPFIPVP